MEEVNVEGTSQACAAADSVNLLGSNTDSKPLVSFDFHESSEADHTKQQSEDTGSLTSNDFHANYGEENCHHQFEGKGISPRNSEDTVQAESSIYKASEIVERFIQALDNRVLVDTAAPIESVKDAVSKFGGILDWKERRRHVQLALDKVQEDCPAYLRRAEATEVEKNKVLQELGVTRRLIEGLKLSLEKQQTEATQAQQDSQLAEIRFKEIQQGVAHRESAAAKAELDATKDRHVTALENLQSVKEELECLQKEYTCLVAQRDIAVRKARESTAVAQEIEKNVEYLTLELISLKGLLDSSHTMHFVVQDQRINAASTFEQEKVNWENELKQADEEVQKLTGELSATKDLECKLRAASALLVNRRAELFAYVEGTWPQKASDAGEAERPKFGVRMVLERTKKELDDVKANIEMAKDEVKCLRVIATSLRTDLEKEKADITALRQKESLASVSVSSIDEELSRTMSELAMAQERAKAVHIPVELRQATQGVAQTMLMARLAHEEVVKAREHAERAKAEVSAMEIRLEVVLMQAFAANTSQEIVTASANALKECKPALEVESKGDQSDNDVTLSLEEYSALSKRARETEDLAKKRVIKAVEKIKQAKEAEVRRLDKLRQLAKQIEERRVALRAAQEKAVVAKDGKLAMEDELRKWRAEHEQGRKAGEAARGLAEISTLEEASTSSNGASGSNPHILSPRAYLHRADTIVTSTATEPKSQKSFFPRILMFVARKKAQSFK